MPGVRVRARARVRVRVSVRAGAGARARRQVVVACDDDLARMGLRPKPGAEARELLWQG